MEVRSLTRINKKTDVTLCCWEVRVLTAIKGASVYVNGYLLNEWKDPRHAKFSGKARLYYWDLL